MGPYICMTPGQRRANLHSERGDQCLCKPPAMATPCCTPAFSTKSTATVPQVRYDWIPSTCCLLPHRYRTGERKDGSVRPRSNQLPAIHRTAQSPSVKSVNHINSPYEKGCFLGCHLLSTRLSVFFSALAVVEVFIGSLPVLRRSKSTSLATAEENP